MNHLLPHVRLERHLDISSFGCEIMAAGDINGDGKTELIFCQCAGMLTLDIFKPGGTHSWFGSRYTMPEDQALDCLTAIDLQGRVLWQRGRPWRGKIPFRTHGGEQMLIAQDIDGDGRQELVRIRDDQIETINGSTGRTLASASLGATGYSSIFTGRCQNGRPRQILVKPCSDGLPGHSYGCPVLLLDHQLRPLWGPKDYTHVGHTPLACDVDGDGRDEILIGFDCVNPDGSVRWTLPLSANTRPGEGHDDRRTIADIDGDGRLEQVIAAEDFGLVASDLAGRVLWRCPSDHCGEAAVGKFFADRPGLQIMFNNEAWRVATHEHPFASMMVDGQGREIWRCNQDYYATAIDWPTAVGPQALLTKPHAMQPDDYRPFVMDGSGRKIAEFDIPRQVPAVEKKQMPHTGVVGGDWGDYYCHRVVNLEGKGQCILIWTRKDLWVFRLEA